MDIMNVEEYKTWIGGIARRYRQSQIKAATAVNPTFHVRLCGGLFSFHNAA